MIMSENKFYINCYHGSRKSIEHPDITYSRNDIDFGVGFYMTKDDVIIGPTVDDKLFSTLDMYADGLLSTNEALEVINCMKYNEQIVIKNQDTINNNLMFKGSKELKGQEKQHFIEIFKQDRIEANRKTEEMIRSFKRKR